jgi:hypothetical protein
MFDYYDTTKCFIKYYKQIDVLNVIVNSIKMILDNFPGYEEKEK